MSKLHRLLLWVTAAVATACAPFALLFGFVWWGMSSLGDEPGRPFPVVGKIVGFCIFALLAAACVWVAIAASRRLRRHTTPGGFPVLASAPATALPGDPLPVQPVRDLRRFVWLLPLAGIMVGLVGALLAGQWELRQQARDAQAGEMRQSAVDARCWKNLKAIESAIQLYANENRGALPSTLQTALANVDVSPADLHHHPDNRGAVEYAYIDWSSHFNYGDLRALKYPIVYDISRSPHAGRSVQILLSDGSVIEDFNAEWLRSFAAKHSEVTIDIPRALAE